MERPEAEKTPSSAALVEERLSARSYQRLSPKVWVAGGLMLLLGVAASVLLLRDFRSESYLYLAFYAVPANTAISIFPHEPVLIYFGKFANLWITAGAATVGTIVAALLDHTVFTPLLNLEGRQGFKDSKLYRKSVKWFMRYPFATIVVAGFSPIPFWPFKLLTFSIHYPLRRYLLAVVVARFPRYYLLAWAGAVLDLPNALIFGIFGVIILIYAAQAGSKLSEGLRGRGGPTPEAPGGGSP